MTGDGFEAVTFAVAELLFATGSGVDELTVAVLLIAAPLASEQFTLATRVMVADAPAASEVKLTVRLLPDPPQTPPPVAAVNPDVRRKRQGVKVATPLPLDLIQLTKAT
jgi:hypothetical protein